MLWPGDAEEERAPFSGSSLGVSARLMLAERALAEVTAQRNEALQELEAVKEENATLTSDLERAQSYQSLYAAAHEVCVCGREECVPVRIRMAHVLGKKTGRHTPKCQ